MSPEKTVFLFTTVHTVSFYVSCVPFFQYIFSDFSRLLETDLSRVMDEKEAADECNTTAQKEEEVSILHFFEIRCFSVILLIYFQNSASPAVAVISLDFVQKTFFFFFSAV